MCVSYFLKIALSNNKSLHHKKLEDLKPHDRLISINSDAPASDAVNEMNIHLVESVVVLDEMGRLEGIVTSKDLMNAIFFDEKFDD